MSAERDGAASPTERAEAEAQRIIRAAVEQAAMLQVRMAEEVEARVRERVEITEREVAARLELAERDAQERTRRALETATAVLRTANQEASRIREELVEARAELEAIRHQQRVEGGGAGSRSHDDPARAPRRSDLGSAPTHAGASEARHGQGPAPLRQPAPTPAGPGGEVSVAQLVADAVAWGKKHRADADRMATQQLLDAEAEARRILERAHARAARIDLEVVDPDGSAGLDAVRRPTASDGVVDLRDLPDPPEASSGPRRRFGRWGTSAGIVLLVAAVAAGVGVVRAFVAEPFTVASTSMEPQVSDGDRVLVNKVAYWFGDVGRGDVVVFEPSSVPGAADLGDTLLKRVIGLPGDTVEGVDGAVLVNGERLEEPWLHEVWTDPFPEVDVPEGALFVLGDERGASIDSRRFGPVPVGAIEGRVEAVVWPPGHLGRP